MIIQQTTFQPMNHVKSGNNVLIIYAGAVVISSLTAAFWFALSRGQDFNWDQQNYHLGIPFLLAHRTFWDSIAPVGSQSYFNPYVIQAQFWAMSHMSPKLFAVCLACVQAPAFMLSGLICAIIVRPISKIANMILALLGFALCLAAPMSLSEAGTTLIDLVTAVPVLAAYALLLMSDNNRAQRTIYCIGAGLFLGVATALKLTNGVFALAAVGFTIANGQNLRERLRETSLVYGATLFGFLAVGAWWYFNVWARFGNPFFPYYNDIFHSPDFARTELHDTRFLPQSVLDIWRYPMYWLLGGSPKPNIGSPSSEALFTDGRWVIAAFGTTLFLASRFALRGRAWLFPRGPVLGLLFAFAIGYTLWLFQFGIHRYLVPLDILCGAIILLIIVPCRDYLLKIGAMVIFVVATLLVIRVPNWSHRPWSRHWEPNSSEIVHLPPRSLVFLADRPSLMIALSLPRDTRYAEIAGSLDLNAAKDTGLTRQLRYELSLRPGLEVENQRPLSKYAVMVLRSYGLEATDRCRLLTSGGRHFRICDVRSVVSKSR